MNTEILVSEIIKAIKEGKKVITFGVGGNAANAIHFAAELAGKFEQYEKPLPCIDLCSNVAVLTAIAQDFGWEHVFERQIRGLAKPGDVLVAFSISTSGQYLAKALDEAVCVPCECFLICGRETRTIADAVYVMEFDSLDTPSVQEEQLKIIHQICGKVKASLSGK
jgi:D-sedoheptulose 7-phosphate isomerase